MKTAKKGNKNTPRVLLPHLIIDNVREGIITVDLKGRILFINHSALEILGRNNTPSNLSRAMKKYREASLINCLPRRNRKFFKDGVARIKDAHNLKQLILKTDIKGKRIKAVFSHLKKNRPDKIIGILISLTNIAEEALINERKTNFISDVSHALRTPITAIQGAAELMLRGIGGMPNKKHEEFSQIISKNCKRLNNLINDVVRMAKYESNSVPLNLKKTYLTPIIENYLIEFDKKIKEKAIIVEKTLPPFVNVAMNIDPEKIGEVIAILLTNAIRYTPKNGRIRINVDVKDNISKSEIESKLYNPDSKQGLVEVNISNECKGISEREISRLFDKYEKVKNFKLEGGKPDTDGKVLTLPLARMLVESHDGKMWAESKEGGCSFHFTIPLFKRKSVRKEKETASIVEVLPQTDEIIEIDEGPKALIVNDNPTVFKAYKDALERSGFKIFEGKDEEEAIDLARRHRPTIIIIDVLMPGVDGAALVKVLREDPETKGIPVMISSALDNENTGLKELKEIEVIKRPLDEGEFLNQINLAISNYQLKRDTEGKILIVDDEESIASLLSSMLQEFGYKTIVACTGEDALNKAVTDHPDLILLDINLPGINGFQTLERLKNNLTTGHAPVIILSGIKDAKEKAKGLNLGASDYITKPYSSLELEARIKQVLQRREEEYNTSPTTRLPGNVSIEKEINARINGERTFSVCYVDLDNFKAYNDHYGFLKGDAVIKQTAKIITGVVREYGNNNDFVGHIGGDDFIIITTPEAEDNICRSIIDSFNKIMPLYYNKEDRTRGYIELENRRSQIERFPIITISIAVVTSSEQRRLRHFAQISDIAAEVKKAAKKIEGSVYIKDRRSPLEF